MVAWQAVVCALAMSASDETVLLDFSASWCGPCRQMEPVVQQLTAAGFPIRKVDIDQQPELAKRFRVDGVPCFVMLVNGQEAGRQVGAVSRAQLEQLLRLAPPAGNATGETPRPRLIPKQITEPFNRVAQGIRDAVTGPQPAPYVDPQVIERCMSASVRLRVHDADGKSTGTGTIVDCRSGEALIVTCGHIFRDSKGKGEIDVDLFGANGRRTIPGQVVSYDLKSDIGLVRIRPNTHLITATPAPVGSQLRKGDSVVSVGCSHGDDPTSKVSNINSLNKFQGPANIQVAGQPVQGRSGGGLFNSQGELIGVCNAADPSDNEGLYAALAVIHGELVRVGLDQVLARPGELAVTPPQMPSGFAAPEQPVTRSNAQSPDPVVTTQVTLTSDEATVLKQVREKAGAAEVICIVRPQNDPQAKSEVIVIDRASPELLERLGRDHQHRTSRVETPAASPTIIPQVRGTPWLPKFGR